MSKNGLMAAVALAVGLKEEEAATIKIDAAFISQYFPEAAADIAKKGAKAEQDRIAGIEAFAGLGQDKIVAAHKADPSKTALDAGLAVAAAQRAVLKNANTALDDDENKVKGLRSEANSGSDPAPKKPGEGLEGEPNWKAEWDGSAALQAEFSTQSQYVALKKAERDGMVKRLQNRKA